MYRIISFEVLERTPTFLNLHPLMSRPPPHPHTYLNEQLRHAHHNWHF